MRHHITSQSMVAHSKTVALSGVNATMVDVQVQIAPGLPAFQIVGLPDNAVRESRERVRGAFHALGLSIPAKRITVNLAPADISKEGSHYDLPIAIGLLQVMKVVEPTTTAHTIFMGELGLDGSLNAVPGCLPAAIHGKSKGCSQIFTPATNANEAAYSGDLEVFGASNLQDIIAHLKGEQLLSAVTITAPPPAQHFASGLDLADIRGQESAKRAAEIAAAGGHNMLMVGPPGSGKSMLAARIPGLLPPMEKSEMLEVSAIHSVAGMMNESGVISARPFRDPHHSASAVALTGGGMRAKPGEMSLSHGGVLFLDELPEFPRQVLETLRQPIETGKITVSRANHHVTYPANFQLIAAMNPCPCGYLADANKACSRAPKCAEKYQEKISGPLLDRFDLHVTVPAVNIKDLSLPPATEGSKEVAARVATARTMQQQRYAAHPQIRCNADLNGEAMDSFAKPEADGEQLLQQAASKYGLSARGYHRVLRVARTIADLQNSPNITRNHIAEALAYRGVK